MPLTGIFLSVLLLQTRSRSCETRTMTACSKNAAFLPAWKMLAARVAAPVGQVAVPAVGSVVARARAAAEVLVVVVREEDRVAVRADRPVAHPRLRHR